MNTAIFISQCLEQVQIRLRATCEGLSQEQVLWRPFPHANSIGFILWHVARAEDERVTSLPGGVESLWISEEWHKRFGQPADSPDPGDRMGFHALHIPELDTLLGYLDAAHQQTQDFLSSLGDNGLDSEVTTIMRHLITHKNNHHGQIDYIRGLQDDAWDLPRGTGMSLPS